MTREDKIAKLRKLGVYRQWDYNIVIAHGTVYREYLLNCNDDNWNLFIRESFIFHKTPEGDVFWHKISNE